MKLFAVLLVAFLVLSQSERDPSIGFVRTKFHNATSSEKICKDLIKLLEPYSEKNKPLFLGYKGGATMLMAKHVINPISKFSYFKKGRNMLENAIKADNSNVELRFLRYTIQNNVPSFLGYNGQLAKDELFLKQSVGNVRDAELKKIITYYLKQKK
jgi:hypothetical protein